MNNTLSAVEWISVCVCAETLIAIIQKKQKRMMGEERRKNNLIWNDHACINTQFSYETLTEQ